MTMFDDMVKKDGVSPEKLREMQHDYEQRKLVGGELENVAKDVLLDLINEKVPATVRLIFYNATLREYRFLDLTHDVIDICIEFLALKARLGAQKGEPEAD